MQAEIESKPEAWLRALPFAVGVNLLSLALFTYWFAVADRYRIFLYLHDMGPNVPDTSPFSLTTSSRYWMSSLVAAGAVMVLYAGANWLLARVRANYAAPGWWRVWTLSLPGLLVGIPLITMTQNDPVLPMSNALAVTAMAIIATALALSPGKLAAEEPSRLAWLALDGFGLTLMLISLPGLQFLGRWLENDQTMYVMMLVFSVIVGVGWLMVMSALLIWRDREIPEARELVLSGFALAYLLMPLLHHLLFTDGYYYITDSDNFLARNPLLQLAIWFAVVILAIGVTALRKRWAQSRQAR